MSDGTISIKLAPDYEMSTVQTMLEDYGTGEDIIRNEGFFPNISLSKFRNLARTDGTITESRVQDALIEAMAAVNDELAPLKKRYAGKILESVESEKINGESLLVYRYRRAVNCFALANLYERYLSYDTTNDGEKKTELLKESITELRRDARFAINDLLARPRVDAELI